MTIAGGCVLYLRNIYKGLYSLRTFSMSQKMPHCTSLSRLQSSFPLSFDFKDAVGFDFRFLPVVNDCANRTLCFSHLGLSSSSYCCIKAVCSEDLFSRSHASRARCCRLISIGRGFRMALAMWRDWTLKGGNVRRQRLDRQQ
jgi:hypothetical protein